MSTPSAQEVADAIRTWSAEWSPALEPAVRPWHLAAWLAEWLAHRDAGDDGQG